MKVDIDKVLSEVAVEHGITKFHAEMIYKSIFEMVAETMREGDIDNILLPKFGKFIVPRKKLMLMNPGKYDKKYGTE
jgi:nucleoid DNA-binding protein